MRRRSSIDLFPPRASAFSGMIELLPPIDKSPASGTAARARRAADCQSFSPRNADRQRRDHGSVPKQRYRKRAIARVHAANGIGKGCQRRGVPLQRDRRINPRGGGRYAAAGAAHGFRNGANSSNSIARSSTMTKRHQHQSQRRDHRPIGPWSRRHGDESKVERCSAPGRNWGHRQRFVNSRLGHPRYRSTSIRWA